MRTHAASGPRPEYCRMRGAAPASAISRRPRELLELGRVGTFCERSHARQVVAIENRERDRIALGACPGQVQVRDVEVLEPLAVAVALADLFPEKGRETAHVGANSRKSALGFEHALVKAPKARHEPLILLSPWQGCKP
jgi:hypothetical protein